MLSWDDPGADDYYSNVPSYEEQQRMKAEAEARETERPAKLVPASSEAISNQQTDLTGFFELSCNKQHTWTLFMKKLALN